MIPITYKYFLPTFYLPICADFVSRRGESDFASGIGVVEKVSEGDKSQAIVMAERFLGF
jgi:hypothetical protein